MKYYIIAGEPSGDLHASNLMREIKIIDKDAKFRFWGGDLMAKQGGEMVAHYKDTAFMGVFQVVMNLSSIFKNLKKCREDIVAYSPDVVILVDYPGFNMRIAKFAKNAGFKTYYYIAPKIWAWNQGRVHKIKKYIDKVFTILPFETDFYAKYDVPVVYSGNPTLDALSARENQDETIENFRKRTNLDEKPIISLLAGSREEELERLLPEMLNVVQFFPEYQFVIAGAPSFTIENYKKYIDNNPQVKVLFDEAYSLLTHSYASLVTSGTATLEAGLLNSPQVVCYKMWGGRFASFLAKKIIIKVPFVSLVNLIMGREVVKELFQEELTQETLRNELDKICNDAEYRSKMLQNYDELRKIMGEPGSSKKTAQLMWEDLNNRNS